MPQSLLTRTIITRNLFKQADLAGLVIDGFDVAAKETGSVAIEYKVKLESAGVVYVFIVHNTMAEGDLKDYLKGMLKGMREAL